MTTPQEAQFSRSRSMPDRHEWVLAELEGGQRTYDGRRAKTMTWLGELGWVVITGDDPKNPRKHTYAITAKGKEALERQKRGVDPYLRMTA